MEERENPGLHLTREQGHKLSSLRISGSLAPFIFFSPNFLHYLVQNARPTRTHDTACTGTGKYMAEVTGAHSSELMNHHMTNITRSQFAKLNLNLKKLIIIIKPTMGMSLRRSCT